MTFVDTNYFLRYLLKDSLFQHNKAKELFLKGAQGKIKLFTSIIVIFETYWVLSSFYNKGKRDVVRVLENILSMVFVKVSNREPVVKAVAIYKRSSFDLEDAYNLAYALSKDAAGFKTFDQKLEKRFKRLV